MTADGKMVAVSRAQRILSDILCDGAEDVAALRPRSALRTGDAGRNGRSRGRRSLGLFAGPYAGQHRRHQERLSFLAADLQARIASRLDRGPAAQSRRLRARLAHYEHDDRRASSPPTKRQRDSICFSLRPAAVRTACRSTSTARGCARRRCADSASFGSPSGGVIGRRDLTADGQPWLTMAMGRCRAVR